MIGVTTYAGSVQQRLILRQVLRHLRWRNTCAIRVLVVSDGHLTGSGAESLADLVVSRAGPSGLQRGELESVRWLISVAKAMGAEVLIKTCGDVILDQPEWALKVLDVMRCQRKRMLSTHWFHDDSWIVGTKFFVAEVAFLDEVWPDDTQGEPLEVALTKAIAAKFRVADAVHLVNSETGERHETRGLLRELGWEHAHRIYKFIRLDADAGLLERCFNSYLLYPVFRIANLLRRLQRRPRLTGEKSGLDK